jgi:fructokinase
MHRPVQRRKAHSAAINAAAMITSANSAAGCNPKPTASRAKPASFFFDRVSPGILDLARWARAEGAVLMFEPSSFSDDKAFRTAVELCHILKFSKERLGHVKDFANTAHPLIVIETQGEQGLRIRWHAKWTSFDAFDAPRFVDAAGADDWCSAGFLHMVSQRGSAGLADASKGMIERSVRLGQALSALNCYYEGATGLMEALSVTSASKLLHTLLGGKGELPETGDTRSTRKIPLCASCKPEKQPSRQVLSKRDVRAR